MVKALAKTLAETEILGRPLRKDERVYFIDGDEDNVSVGNLVVVPNKEYKKVYVCPDCKKERMGSDYENPNRSSKCNECYKKAFTKPRNLEGVYDCPGCGVPVRIHVDCTGKVGNCSYHKTHKIWRQYRTGSKINDCPLCKICCNSWKGFNNEYIDHEFFSWDTCWTASVVVKNRNREKEIEEKRRQEYQRTKKERDDREESMGRSLILEWVRENRKEFGSVELTSLFLMLKSLPSFQEWQSKEVVECWTRPIGE